MSGARGFKIMFFFLLSLFSQQDFIPSVHAYTNSDKNVCLVGTLEWLFIDIPVCFLTRQKKLLKNDKNTISSHSNFIVIFFINVYFWTITATMK